MYYALKSVMQPQLRQCADINFISFVFLMHRISKNVFLDHLEKPIFQSFPKSHRAMVSAFQLLLEFSWITL